MTIARVAEASVTVNNSPIQNYVHPDYHTQPTYESYFCKTRGSGKMAPPVFPLGLN